MKMKRTLMLVILLSSCCLVNAQADLKNAVFAEIGGNGYYYSVNYERNLSKRILVRLGIGTANGFLTIPVLGGKYFGDGKHHFEMTGGVTFASESINPSGLPEGEIRARHLFATTFIGYRYQTPEKKFLFRVGYTPLLRIYSSYAGTSNDNHVYQMGGLSFGYRF